MCLSKQLQDVWGEHGAETETERNKELVFEAWIRLQEIYKHGDCTVECSQRVSAGGRAVCTAGS